MIRVNLIIRILTLLLFAGSIRSQDNASILSSTLDSAKTKQMKQDWYFKDLKFDSIPGISLERIENKDKFVNKKPIIIAVLDTEVNINHDLLKDNIWINTDEISGNSLDDDKNGYVDDINGWNYVGNIRGQNTFYMNYESTRIIREYKKAFESVDSTNLSKDQLLKYKVYQKAKKFNNLELNKISSNLPLYLKFYKSFKAYKSSLDSIFGNNFYTTKDLDSLLLIRPNLEESIVYVKRARENNVTVEDMLKDINFHRNSLDRYLNVNYNDREIIGDNFDKYKYDGYGNPYVAKHTDSLYHGTLVAGIFARFFENFPNANYKILPLAISVNGDEHDKDIALAIKYAVDNGAKVINISSSKQFSLHEKWVIDAIKYAQNHNAMIVTSAGNNSYNLDLMENSSYPNDIGFEDQIKNLFLVGASTETYNENLLDDSSNYGRKNVDLFAPGDNIYTVSSRVEEGEFVSGTSFSTPIVSSTIALIWSQFPNLSVYDMKEVLLNSTSKYNIKVKLNADDSEFNKLVPFSSLSKSGGIVNAYNALKMAEAISKK